jgi:hypothetical protein
MQHTFIGAEEVADSDGQLKITRNGPGQEKRSLLLEADGSGVIELKDGTVGGLGGEVYASAVLTDCSKQ